MDQTEGFKLKVITTVGKVPNGLISNFNGITYYIQTNFARTKEDHEAAVQPAVEELLDKNEGKYTSWVETKRELLVFSPVSQVTVVSFRVRDMY